MRVFISWSGEQSKTVAFGLRDWLPLVLHYIEPWLSEADIGAGERWAHSVAQQLSDSNYGIICVTAANVNSPWMLFEAGALAKSLETSRVVPLLLDLDFSDVTGPLAQFQAKKLTRAGLREVIDSLQFSAPNTAPEERVNSLFNALWPELEARFAEIPGAATGPKNKRLQSDILEELVTTVRTLDARILQGEGPASSPADHHSGNLLNRLDLGTIKDMIAAHDESDSPIGFLIYGAFFQEDIPWLYELALESYRNLLSGRDQSASLSIRSLARLLDDRSGFQLVKSGNPRASSLVRYEFLRYLQRYEHYLPPRDPPHAGQ
jgi:hypothetical protein